MKKIVYLFVLAFLFASCEKEDVGGTATQDMAGQWYVHVDAVDENGDLVYSDDELYGIGNFLILTYNTSDNSSDKMFVDDLGNFWTFKSKVDCDLSSSCFSGGDVFATEYVANEDLSTYNNFYYHAGKFDAEKWKWYKEGESQFKKGIISKDSLDKMLTEYFEIADDTVSAGYFVKYLNFDYEVGQKLIGITGEGDEVFADDVKNACNTTITDGKILNDAATTPSGMPADSIVFYVEFDDDYTEVDEDVFEYTPAVYGFAKYRISGYRYTGFALDD